MGSLYFTHERPTVLQCVAGVLIVCGVFIGMAGSLTALMNISLPGLFWGLLAVRRHVGAGARDAPLFARA